MKFQMCQQETNNGSSLIIVIYSELIWVQNLQFVIKVSKSFVGPDEIRLKPLSFLINNFLSRWSGNVVMGRNPGIYLPARRIDFGPTRM